ncbi:MAG: hypothetical protein ACD_66C00077G0001, partial [uncultured bacterium]
RWLCQWPLLELIQATDGIRMIDTATHPPNSIGRENDQFTLIEKVGYHMGNFHTLESGD